MQTGLETIMKKAGALGAAIIGRSAELDEHILSIHRQTSIESLVARAARSLKDVLDYQLFAFVLEETDGLHIWSDPLLHRNRLRELTAKDFHDTAISRFYHIQNASSKVINPLFHEPEMVSSHAFSDAGQKARLYLSHTRPLSPMGKRRVKTLIASVENALGTLLKIRDLERRAATDPLTGCYNRRALTGILEHDLHHAQRYHHPLSLVMMDIDHFKSINDTHGHLVGDEVLRSLSLEIPGVIRKSDTLVRYGGEEFVIVLPEASLDQAEVIAHRIRKRIESLSIRLSDGTALAVTASFGVAEATRDDDSQSLLAEADAMLYEAKHRGRNDVMSRQAMTFVPLRSIG
jgi:diguanylate cyclase (GGDEF)-like protein